MILCFNYSVPFLCFDFFFVEKSLKKMKQRWAQFLRIHNIDSLISFLSFWWFIVNLRFFCNLCVNPLCFLMQILVFIFVFRFIIEDLRFIVLLLHHRIVKCTFNANALDWWEWSFENFFSCMVKKKQLLQLSVSIFDCSSVFTSIAPYIEYWQNSHCSSTIFINNEIDNLLIFSKYFVFKFVVIGIIFFLIKLLPHCSCLKKK